VEPAAGQNKVTNKILSEKCKKTFNCFNYYYSSVFSSEGNIQRIQCANSGEPFTIDMKIIRKRGAAIGKNKLTGPDSISGEIPKLGGEAMIPYLVQLLDVTINNGTRPADWKRAMMVPVYKGGDRSLVTNYRPVSLTSVVCKQMEHVIASYLRQVWDKNDWFPVKQMFLERRLGK
jgi:hypothetical protein